MKYRLHIDIPLTHNEEESINITHTLMTRLFESQPLDVIEQINYRVGHDDDRQKSNYLSKNENGHVNNKKNRIKYTEEST